MNWFAKMIFDLKKSFLKKYAKSRGCLSKVLNLVKLIKKLSLHSAISGSILIEFAVCMPVLLILLYYVHDLSKLKRYYDQTEFVAQQMVNIIQNIAKKKENGEAVTIKNIGHAAKMAYLSIYPGNTMYAKYRNVCHMPRVYVHYVEKDGDNNASCRWGLWMHTKTSAIGRWNNGTFTSGDSQSTVTMGKNVNPSSIYPTLKIDEKPKVIVEAQLAWRPDYVNADGKTANSAREAFGCFAATPKLYTSTTYFPSVVTFTPCGGFSENKITGA